MIAIVGGGITGLAIGWHLQRLGCEFMVLEGASRVGGVIRSAEVDGRVLDWGPQRVRYTARVRQLVEQLHLEDQLLAAPAGLPLYVHRGGRLREVPQSVAGFIGSDVLSTAAKLRAALEPLTAGPNPEESVAEYFTRKLGREFYETLAGPLYGGLYASDPADMTVGLSLVHALRELGVGRSLVLKFLERGGRVSAPPACSFRDGMQTLPEALARSLGRHLRVDEPVRRVTRDGVGWRVETEGGAVDASHLVLTTPAAVTSRLLMSAHPPLAGALKTLRYNPLAIVHVDTEADLRGLGFQVALTEGHLALRGVTFNDSLFGRRRLHTLFLGGARHPEVARWSVDEIAARALADYRHCTGSDARVLAVERQDMPAWDVTWRCLQGVEVPTGLHFAANWWSRPGLPGRLAAAEAVAVDLAGRLTAGDLVTGRA